MAQDSSSTWESSHQAVHTPKSGNSSGWQFFPPAPSSMHGFAGGADLATPASAFCEQPPASPPWHPARPLPQRPDTLESAGRNSAFAPPSRRSSDASTHSSDSCSKLSSSDSSISGSLLSDANNSAIANSAGSLLSGQASSSSEETPSSLLPSAFTLLPPPQSSLPPPPSSSGSFSRPPGLGPPSDASSSLGGATGTNASGAFVCPHCGFTVSSKFHYNSHMNTHGDHVCSMCDYRSRTEGRLKKHMRESHTAEQQLAAGLETATPTPAAPTPTPASASAPATPRLSSAGPPPLVSSPSVSTSTALTLSVSSFSTPTKDSATSSSSTSSSLDIVVDVTSLPLPVPPPSEEKTAEVSSLSDHAASSSLTSTLLGILNSTSSLTSPSALDQMRAISEQPMAPSSSSPAPGVLLSLPAALSSIGLPSAPSAHLPLPAPPTSKLSGGRSREERRSKVKTYKCKQCAHVSTSKEEQWAHSRTHIPAEKQLNCGQCNFVTEYKHHLEYHLRNHIGSKPFQCSKCVYICVNKSMLNSHMKSHTDVYQFRCQDCTYATKYCHSLKLHLKKYGHRKKVDDNGSHPSMGASAKADNHDISMEVKEEELSGDLLSRDQMDEDKGGGASLPTLLKPIPFSAGSALNSSPFASFSFSPIVTSQSLTYASQMLLRHHQLDQMNSLIGCGGNSLSALSASPPSLHCQLCDFETRSQGELLRHNMEHLLNSAPSGNPSSAVSSLYSQLPPSLLQAKWQREDDDTTSPGDEASHSTASTGSPAGSGKGSCEDEHGGGQRRRVKAARVDQISRRLREKTSPELAASPDNKHEAMDVEESTVVKMEGGAETAMATAEVMTEEGADNDGLLSSACLSHESSNWDWQCMHCKMGFQDQAIHQIHMGYHGFESAFQCNRCGHIAGDALSFNLHLLQASHM